MTTIDNAGVWSRITVTIPSGQAVTGNIYAVDDVAAQAVHLGFRIAGVHCTDDWTAADLLLEGGLDESSCLPLTDNDDAPFAMTNLPSSGGFLRAFDATHVIVGALPFVRLRSVGVGTEANENQAEARTLTFILAR